MVKQLCPSCFTPMEIPRDADQLAIPGGAHNGAAKEESDTWHPGISQLTTIVIPEMPLSHSQLESHPLLNNQKGLDSVGFCGIQCDFWNCVTHRKCADTSSSYMYGYFIFRPSSTRSRSKKVNENRTWKIPPMKTDRKEKILKGITTTTRRTYGRNSPVDTQRGTGMKFAYFSFRSRPLCKYCQYISM
ncbi:hypothetical protein DUI87_09368 [Hirundo rustica rustica]|uniref:Uncharacterized protein n=1 Tax=Hirundo rustica rustica TaxID=333673 RepID=A0A3M0L4V8_HIRRU|nr:hypothetical protein DUI87_09368 [Hirundo rustica rustica]